MRKATLNTEAIELRCEALGIDSVSELARRVGVERSYLSRVLRGERPAQPSLVNRLAEVLNCRRLTLLGPEDPTAALAALDDGAVAS